MSYIGKTPTPAPLTSSDITDGIISTDKLAANAVVTSKITDGTIATADIADNAINLAKMASGTDGNIISYDASGNPVAVATGSAGQVLTSAGAGAQPAFATAGGGDYVRLAGTDNTAGSQININGHFSADYKYYRLYGRMMGNSNSYPEVRIMQGGSTMSGDLYKYCAGGSQSDSGASSNTQNFAGRGTNHVRLSVWNNQDINQTKDFTITISNPIKVVNERPTIQWDCWGLSTGNEWQHVQGFAIYDNSVSWTGISLITSDGDTGCKWITDLYGLKHS